MKKGQVFASFARSDSISGTVKVVFGATHKHGDEVKAPYVGMTTEERIESNRVYRVGFDHSKYEKHVSKVMEGAAEVPREVGDFEIFHINRRFFNGERAIKTCEEVLGFETTMSNVHRGGYQNNHATYVEGVRQPGYGGGGYQRRQYDNERSNIGKRPRDNNVESCSQEPPQHRSRYENNDNR